MADLSVAGGIGQGLLSFVNTYQKQKQLDDENARNQQYVDLAKQNQQAGLLSKGMQVGDNGQVSYTPEAQQMRQSQLQTEKMSAEQEKDELDPNSDVSKYMENFTKQRLEQIQPGASKNIPSGKSASYYKNTYKDYLPEQEKFQNELNKAKINATAKTDVAGMRNEGSGEKDKDKNWQKVQSMLESARGNPGVSQAEKDLLSKAKIDALVNKYPNPDKLSPQEVKLLVAEAAKAASGGVPTGHEQEALSPGTAEFNLKSLYSKLANEPTGANAGEFVKRIKDYSDDIGKVAEQVIQDKYGRIIESNKDNIGEKHYNDAKENYINRFIKNRPKESNAQGLLGNEKSSVSMKSHPKDDAMLAWAKANPGAKGAQEVLKANGITQPAGQ